MRTVDLIQRKRGGEELSPEEIEFLVNVYTNGDIPDYQMSAFLMAVYFSGMTDREVSRLTECTSTPRAAWETRPASLWRRWPRRRELWCR